MIKLKSFCAGLRTRHVSIICFALAISTVVCDELKAIPLKVAQCGDNVTLTCEATISSKSEMTNFAWVGNKTCKYNQTNPESQCASANESLHYRLNLTLINVMPQDQGDYTCKLHSIQGVKNVKTFVRVKDCLGSSDSYISKSHVTCWFDGVYPRGIIHWFQGDVNLTDSIILTEGKKDHYEPYNVSSTISVQAGVPTQSYRCSLWIPSEGKYLSSLNVTQPSSGSMDRLQWIWIMVEIMMVKFIL